MPTIHEDLKDFYKGYQGACPEKAKFLFIGSDANFASDIAGDPIFPRVKEYLHNGADFWREHNVHHPFLLSAYKGMGKPYHRGFRKIGFTKCHADEVSFLELLHYPTEDEKSDVKPRDLCDKHLDCLNGIIRSDKKKFVFITSGVVRLMRKTKKFPWLSLNEKGVCRNIKQLWQDEETGAKIFRFHSFSSGQAY